MNAVMHRLRFTARSRVTVPLHRPAVVAVVTALLVGFANLEAVAQGTGTAVGKNRPDFVLPDVSGNARNVSEWNGKVLVVNFWATWCKPCRKEMPLFADLQTEYGGRGLQFVAIAIDKVEEVRTFIAEIGVNFPVLIVDGLRGPPLSQRFGNHTGVLPFTAVVDRAGVIRYVHRGEMKEDLARSFFESLL